MMQTSNKSFVDKQLQEYLDGLLPLLDGELGVLQRRAYDEGLPIISPHVVSLFCGLLASKRPANVLEIGCGIGFSTSLFASFLADGGKVVTIERYDYMAERAIKNFARLGLDDKITLLREDAAVALPRLAESGANFDFIFMDCGKAQYLHFLPYCIDMLAPGGILAVDDVLQRGSVAWDFDKIAKRQRTTYKNLREFLTAAMQAKGCFSSILPMSDGVLLCVKGV